MTGVLIISFSGLDELLTILESTEDFPTIDVEAVLSIIIEIFLINPNADPNNVINYIMHSDILNDRIMLPENDFMKLESIVFNLLLIIQSKIKQIFSSNNDNSSTLYSYMNKRRKDIVLLKRDGYIHTS